VLATLESDPERGLRSCALADGFWRELKGLAVSDPALDVVQTSFATHLMEAPDIVRGLGERATWMCAFWQGAPILARASPRLTQRREPSHPIGRLGRIPLDRSGIRRAQDEVDSGRTPGSILWSVAAIIKVANLLG
jgi:hypothetical protein